MDAVRHEYESQGVAGFYEAVRAGSRDYHNPHERQIGFALQHAAAAWALDGSRVLDLCAGGGEVTRIARHLWPGGVVEATDPYTHALYEQQTGSPCLAVSFADLAAGALTGRAYSLIVCSYALHLASDSVRPVVEIQLSFLAPRLLILSPNRKPVLKHNWRLERAEAVRRVKMSLYASTVARVKGTAGPPTAQPPKVRPHQCLFEKLIR